MTTRETVQALYGAYAARDADRIAALLHPDVLVKPTRKLASSLTTKFAQAKGKHKIQQFEGGPVEVLHLSINGGPSEEAAISFGSVEETSPAVEIKA